MKKIISTVVILFLITFLTQAQYLSYTQEKIVKLLKEQHIEFTAGKTTRGINFIEVKKDINGCKFKYFFDEDNICRKEVITSNDKSLLEILFDIVSNLNEKNYINYNDRQSSYEENFGLVNVYKTENTYTLTYE